MVAASHYYDHPNEQLFPGDGPYGSSFTDWFTWLKGQKLRTYFNDVRPASPLPNDNLNDAYSKPAVCAAPVPGGGSG